MNEKENQTPQAQEQQETDARFWRDAKYEEEKQESDR